MYGSEASYSRSRFRLVTRVTRKHLTFPSSVIQPSCPDGPFHFGRKDSAFLTISSPCLSRGLIFSQFVSPPAPPPPPPPPALDGDTSRSSDCADCDGFGGGVTARFMGGSVERTGSAAQVVSKSVYHASDQRVGGIGENRISLTFSVRASFAILDPSSLKCSLRSLGREGSTIRVI